jgi:hypothetical protein
MKATNLRIFTCTTALAISLAWALTFAGAQSAFDQANPPRIEIANPVFNFGTALEGQHVTHDFVIKNAGKTDLIITNVHTSCGCTVATPAKKHLTPGESVELPVTFDTSFQKGAKVREITIFTNDPKSPQTIVTLQGSVKLLVEADPSEVNFDKVHSGSSANRDLVVSDLTAGKDFHVGSITNSNSNIKVARSPRADGKPGVKLEVALLGSMPIGPFDDTIDIVTNRRPLQVHVFGQVTGDLNLDPAQISFGIVPHGQSALRIVKLTNDSGRPVQVTAVSSTNQSVDAKVEPIAAGKAYKITVELRRNTPDGQLRGQLAIKTDNPSQSTLTVPFYGIIGSFEG